MLINVKNLTNDQKMRLKELIEQYKDFDKLDLLIEKVSMYPKKTNYGN